MKKLKLFSLSLIAALGLGTLVSCELDSFEQLGWQPEILSPVVKTTIDFYDFEDLIRSTLDYNITVGELDVALPGTELLANLGLPIPVPAFGPLDKFDSEYLNIFEYANIIKIDSMEATLSFNNVFPVPIGAGTVIEARDSANTSNVVFHHSIESDIATGETYTFTIKVEDLEISSTMELFVDSMVSPGASSVTWSSDALVIDVIVNFVAIDYIEVLPEIDYAIETTVEFGDLEIDSTDVEAYDGSLYMFLTNRFPTTYELQLILMDQDSLPLHTFFAEEQDSVFLIPAAPVDGGGNVTGDQESGKTKLVDIADVPGFNNAKYLYVKARFKTDSAPPSQYIITEQSTVDLLITADISIDPSKVE